MNPLLPFENLILLIAVILAVSGFMAWRSATKAPAWVRFLVTALRLAAVTVLAVVALNPGQWREQTEERKTAWAVLVDRSASMATPDVNGKSRWDDANRLVGKAVEAATHKENARIYTFANRLETDVADPGRLAKLKPDGESTDIPDAILSLLNTFRAGGTTLTGLILLSDGRQVAATEMTSATILARSRGSPIYPLVIGGAVINKDLSVKIDRRQYVTFVGQKLKITAQIINERLGPVSPVVQLIDPSGKSVAEQKVVFTNDGMRHAQFEITPKERGYFQYRVRVPAWEGEVSVANNEAGVGVAVLESKIRVFMAEGTPFWDSKFLAQLLRQQPNMELISMYRLSSQRFFKVDTDVAKADTVAESVFPDDDVALAKYDMIIFGCGAEYFLTADRIQRLKKFVGEQGGCVIFARGKPYAGSFPELEQLEPVTWGDVVERPFRFRPTQDGEYAGLFGDLLPDRMQPVWSQLPPLRHAHRCARLKAFTHVLVEGVPESADGNSAQAFPLVFSQRYGKGIVVTVNAEDLWQWYFFPTLKEASAMYQDFWVQLFTWAGTYSEFLPGRQYALRLSDTAVYPDVPVRARIYRRSAQAGQVAPLIRVMRGATSVLEMASTATGDDGRWDALFSLKEPGTYRVELAGLDEQSAGGVYATLSIKAPPAEKDNRSADPAYLAKLAEASGGRVIGENELAAMVKSFEPASRPVDLSKAEWVPRWDRSWLLVVLLLVLGMDWFLRRRNGLM